MLNGSMAVEHQTNEYSDYSDSNPVLLQYNQSFYTISTFFSNFAVANTKATQYENNTHISFNTIILLL